MIAAVTGHRPDKLGGYNPQTQLRLERFADYWMKPLIIDEVIVGMAPGWDTAVAITAYRLHVPYVAALPFDGFHKVWPEREQRRFELLCKHALRVVTISDRGSKSAYHARNHWMVDNTDVMYALFDGQPSGGTWATVTYAIKQGKHPIQLWDQWKAFK